MSNLVGNPEDRFSHNDAQMMLPVSGYVSPVKASSSFYEKKCVAAEVINLAFFCCLATIEMASSQLFVIILNSTYIKVCLLVYEKFNCFI